MHAQYSIFSAIDNKQQISSLLFVFHNAVCITASSGKKSYLFGWLPRRSWFLARDSIHNAIARYMLSPVRLPVCLSVCHTGGSVKNG